jgi:hypothetical protein
MQRLKADAGHFEAQRIQELNELRQDLRNQRKALVNVNTMVRASCIHGGSCGHVLAVVGELLHFSWCFSLITCALIFLLVLDRSTW